MQAVAGVLLLAYWTVLVAELVGDKSIYTVASLTMRFSWRRVLPGISAAFACKMLAAVLLGNSLVHMSGRWLALVSAITFFGTAAAFWLRDPDKPEKGLKLHAWSGAVAVSFAASSPNGRTRARLPPLS
jgi:putative Ca2+/H+ antiporter (TMEM165/GDT1 family)